MMNFVKNAMTTMVSNQIAGIVMLIHQVRLEGANNGKVI